MKDGLYEDMKEELNEGKTIIRKGYIKEGLSLYEGRNGGEKRPLAQKGSLVVWRQEGTDSTLGLLWDSFKLY
jgi:hypothetical protein